RSSDTGHHWISGVGEELRMTEKKPKSAEASVATFGASSKSLMKRCFEGPLRSDRQRYRDDTRETYGLPAVQEHQGRVPARARVLLPHRPHNQQQWPSTFLVAKECNRRQLLRLAGLPPQYATRVGIHP